MTILVFMAQSPDKDFIYVYCFLKADFLTVRTISDAGVASTMTGWKACLTLRQPVEVVGSGFCQLLADLKPTTNIAFL